ncbi:LOW QUALITY PROTEIN: uncharacterized protein EMH_0008960 [Eimeria mitis]|uniref:Uncharacterized protein n=1 Tax=Eimeria mitis TaxID=44415 RepID=U6K7F9_9EIME|nr:LOW QUALITY PROTEIN: uncharacterized protein EMH_0008960 [Eimeria mitis]CDJ31413.1 hypothetical protein, conserved [Eimeria mitis]
MSHWSPGGSHPTESVSSVAAEPYRIPTVEGGDTTRGTQLGMQEPLSFYGNVHVSDPMPVAEVPMWIWSSSTVICVLLLLLWALHQRRFSLVAAQLRLIERRCFSPPAALYMSLVYSFFPLSGAIAWLSLLEPRVGLLLSQLRSAWEVCCLHCFMLLMLHLMGGPETTLLLIQQQHSLPPPENRDKAHGDTKQVFISTGVDWDEKANSKEFPSPLPPNQIDEQHKEDLCEIGMHYDRRLMDARRLRQQDSKSSSSTSSSNSNSNSNTNQLTSIPPSKFSATKFYRRGVSAPNLLFPVADLPTAVAASAAAARIPPTTETEPAAEQQ